MTINRVQKSFDLADNEDLNNFSVPQVKNDSLEEYYQVALATIDYQDMMAVNQRLVFCTREFHKYTNAVRLAQEALAEAILAHERAYRRAYLDLENVKPDMVRKERAKLYTEEFEDEVIYYKTQHESFKKLLDGIRQELRTLEILAYNYRKEMQLG